MHTAQEIGAVEREVMRINAEIPTEEDSYGVEVNPNLPTHYSPTLRNHENFSYSGGVVQGQRHRQNPQ